MRPLNSHVVLAFGADSLSLSLSASWCNRKKTAAAGDYCLRNENRARENTAPRQGIILLKIQMRFIPLFQVSKQIGWHQSKLSLYTLGNVIENNQALICWHISIGRSSALPSKHTKWNSWLKWTELIHKSRRCAVKTDLNTSSKFIKTKGALCTRAWGPATIGF